MAMNRSHALAELARARDNVIDLDIVVDDCRRELEAAVKRLQDAVRERDRYVTELLERVDAIGRG